MPFHDADLIFDDGPSTITLPVRRIEVVQDLGNVTKGSHVLMIEGVIISSTPPTVQPQMTLPAIQRLEVAVNLPPAQKGDFLLMISGLVIGIDSKHSSSTPMPRPIEVVKDLGPVNKGDHLLMMDDFVFSVDTSVHQVQQPIKRLTGPTTVTPKKKPWRQHADVKDVTNEAILQVIGDQGPISSQYIGDTLKLIRGDAPARSKVTRILRWLLDNQQIKVYPDKRTRIYRYVLIDYEDAVDVVVETGDISSG